MTEFEPWSSGDGCAHSVKVSTLPQPMPKRGNVLVLDLASFGHSRMYVLGKSLARKFYLSHLTKYKFALLNVNFVAGHYSCSIFLS